MNVVITGGTGFIGSRLALHCLQRGDAVTILGQVNTEAERANRDLLEERKARVILASVTDTDAVSSSLTGADTVIHLAAAQHEMNIPDQRFWDVNVNGTKNVAEASANAGVAHFLHGSTIGVYDVESGVIDESSPCGPDNIYGRTKLEGERVALSYADRMHLVVVRIPEVYGPGDMRLLKLFRVIQKKKFFMIGRGENLHDLIFVGDLIEGFLGVLGTPDAKGEVFQFSGPGAITTNEMVATIAAQLGAPPPKIRVPFLPIWVIAFVLERLLRPLGIQPPLHTRRMDFFKKSFQLSHAKASSVFGFDPKTSFAEGARLTGLWYEETGHLSR